MTQLPEQGRSLASLTEELTARGANDAKWRDGRTAVYVFNAGEDVAQVQKETYALYMSENGLAPRAFPSLKQMEDEVIAMSLGLLHGPDGACGAMASGGSESIVLAMKAARGHARASGKTQPGRTPTVVVPYSAHPAFDKAAALLQKHERVVVEVAGHTDSVGSDEYNMGLSDRRANSVKDYLTAKGVKASRLSAHGYGESRPVASNDTDEGRAENRRVELIVLDR